MRRKGKPQGRLQSLGWAVAVCLLALIAYFFILVRALVGEYN